MQPMPELGSNVPSSDSAVTSPLSSSSSSTYGSWGSWWQPKTAAVRKRESKEFLTRRMAPPHCTFGAAGGPTATLGVTMFRPNLRHLWMGQWPPDAADKLQ